MYKDLQDKYFKALSELSLIKLDLNSKLKDLEIMG
jgi:hypothetical protein